MDYLDKVLAGELPSISIAGIPTEECIPYTEKTCVDVARRLSLNQGSVGRPFASNYDTKGCHYFENGQYANTAFYGTGGTEGQMKTALKSPEKRPAGYDCKFNVTDSLGGECNLDTDVGDGIGYGTIEFLVPSETKNWKLEIEFDQPVSSINADVENVQCEPDKTRCSFQSEDYVENNGIMIMAGEAFDFSYFEVEFDETGIPPKIKRVIFKSCHSEVCDGWTTAAKVCGE